MKLNSKADINNLSDKASPITDSAHPSDKTRKVSIIQDKDISILIKDPDGDCHRKFVRSENQIICSYCRAIVKLSFPADGLVEVIGEHLPKCKSFNSCDKKGILYNITENTPYINNYELGGKNIKSDSEIKSILHINNGSSYKRFESDISFVDDTLHIDNRVYDDHSRGRGKKTYLCTECLCIGKRVEAKIIQVAEEEEHCKECENGRKSSKKTLFQETNNKKVKFNGS